MARGQPDYGATAPKEITGSLSDLAEVAARLNSIVIFDRRGDVAYLDDFEETILKWAAPVIGVSTVALDSTTALSGSQSVKLHTDVGSSATASLVKYFSVLGVLRLGIEISFSDLSLGSDFYFTLSYFDGVSGYKAELWWDSSATTLYARGPTSGVWTEVVNFGELRLGEHAFYSVKLVADFVNHLYERAMFAGNQYDLSTLTLTTFGGAGGAYLLVSFQLVNTVAANHNVWVDDFILTQNEP